MATAEIKLTQRMLDKTEINANKTVQKFLEEDFEMSYTDPFFVERAKLTITGEYSDGERADVRFFCRSKRGDKMLSIKNLKQYAEAGDTVILTSNAKDEGVNEYLIHINIVRETDAAA